MSHGYRLLGFVVIVVLYMVIGFLAAAGTMLIARKLFSPKAEQLFYALFLILIALFYLAFTAYLGGTSAWRVEIPAVAVFTGLGLLGVRLPFALILGYPLHGLWDLLHEFQAAFNPGQLTAIPLAYGFFCAVFDFCMGAYFYTRRATWSAAWKTSPLI